MKILVRRKHLRLEFELERDLDNYLERLVLSCLTHIHWRRIFYLIYTCPFIPLFYHVFFTLFCFVLFCFYCLSCQLTIPCHDCGSFPFLFPFPFPRSFVIYCHCVELASWVIGSFFGSDRIDLAMRYALFHTSHHTHTDIDTHTHTHTPCLRFRDLAKLGCYCS